MSSNYAQICLENIRRYGEETHHLAFLGKLYTEKTHFIYELLQNTEDAGATKVQFHLFADRLEVRHNGRPFDEKDVRGICGVGESTKVEDLNQIGKFGIGFKSVYAYTTCPEIHSADGPTGAEHFRIEYYVRPMQIAAKNPGLGWTTLLIFPFNHLEVPQAETEIANCLKNLSVRTLLFLRKIEEIEYITLIGGSGAYIHEAEELGWARKVTVMGKNTTHKEITIEEWLVFSRPVAVAEAKGEVYVEVAYQLRNNLKTGQPMVTKIAESPLVVFFPTEKETQLGFLIQGPYHTTPARDNVLKNNLWNTQLVNETGILLGETLEAMRAKGLLTLSLFEALPINPEAFREDSFFQPLFTAVRTALIEKFLLPAGDGKYVPPKRIKLARSAELRRLLTNEQLQQLYESSMPLWWLSGEITLDRTPMLRAYFLEELQVEELTPEKFAQLLTTTFLQKQDDDWMIRFYTFLIDHEALWRPTNSWGIAGILSQKPFIRIENGHHVPPYLADKQPAAFLPGATLTNFPIVKRTLASDLRAIEFLRKLGLREASSEDEINQLVQDYQNSDQKISLEDHKIHMQFFVDYYLGSGDLIPFNGGKNCYLFYNQKRNKFSPPTAFYLDLPYCQTGLSAISAVAKQLDLRWDQIALWDGYAEIEGFADFAIALGVLSELPIDKEPTWAHPQQHEFRSGFQQPGKHAIDEDYTIKDIVTLLEAQNHAISNLIWKRMSTAAPEVLQAQYRLNAQEPKIFPSSLVFALRDQTWIPDVYGNFQKPEDSKAEELHPDFIYDDRNGWLTAIGFGANAKAMHHAFLKQQEYAHALGIENIEVVELLQQIDKHPELFQKIKTLLESNKNQPEFPIRESPNPGRRKLKLLATIKIAKGKQFKKRVRSERITKASIDPTASLRNQYINHDNCMVCQICQYEMPFKKRNGNYYFEAVEALPSTYLSKEHEAQYLALCPLCAAMYKEFIKRDEAATATVWQAITTSHLPIIPVQLGDRCATIRFVATHYHDLRTILKHEQAVSLLSEQESFECKTQKIY